MNARPQRVTLHWTLAGRTALLLALSGLAVAVPLGSLVALFPLLVLAAFALSAPFTWLSLRGLEFGAAGRRTVHTGARFEFPLSVTQRAVGLCARDIVVFAAADGPASSRPLAHFDHLGARTARVGPCEWRTRRRGALEQLHLRVVSTFPLGWWRASTLICAPVDWLSLPRLARVDDLELEFARGRREHSHAQRVRRGDDEFYALREARSGDSPHWIHWRSSARRGRLVVRELRGEERPEACVVLVSWVDALALPGRTHAAFEHAVSIAAALVERNVRRGESTRVRFEGPQSWTLRVPPTRSALQGLLARLARVQCSHSVTQRSDIDAALARARRDQAAVVLTVDGFDRSWRVARRAGRDRAAVLFPRSRPLARSTR